MKKPKKKKFPFYAKVGGGLARHRPDRRAGGGPVASKADGEPISPTEPNAPIGGAVRQKFKRGGVLSAGERQALPSSSFALPGKGKGPKGVGAGSYPIPDEGHAMSALSRAAVDNHKHAQIDAGDHVVLSARIIPGNEKGIFRMIDHMFRRGAHVVYAQGGGSPIHVSGHASQEEQRLMLNLVKPRFFIPIHGEYRQLFRHAELASHLRGIPLRPGASPEAAGGLEDTFILESGDILEFDEQGARKAGRVTVGRRCIDSGSLDEFVEDMTIRDRRHISEDGILLPILAINKHTGKVETPPEIVMRGFAAGEADGFIEQAREIVLQTLAGSSDEEKSDYGVIKEKIRADLKRYINKQTQRRPLIMPVILEV